MDVIAGYKTGGTITGDVLIDGRAKDPAIWKKISGYAEQNDILNPYLSVSYELLPSCARDGVIDLLDGAHNISS
jgi:hypothetical protein